MLAPLPCIAAGLAPVVALPAGASPGSIPRCAAGQLVARDYGSGVALGTEVLEVALVKRGPGACTLYGYPHLSMLGAQGRPIATTDRNPLPGFDSVSERVATLALRHDAYFGVLYPDRTGYGTPSESLRCPTAAQLVLKLPGVRGSVTLSEKEAHIAPYRGSIERLHCGDVMLTPVTATPLRPAHRPARD
jgi:hypothetical protein